MLPPFSIGPRTRYVELGHTPDARLSAQRTSGLVQENEAMIDLVTSSSMDAATEKDPSFSLLVESL